MFQLAYEHIPYNQSRFRRYNEIVFQRFAVLTLLSTVVLAAQSPFFPLKDLKPGMQGVGKTVFSGDKIERFQVEILGTLENIGPKESLILGRLSGGPLEKTGVLQGMSGSPVFIDGKLAGAVAMAFPYAKEAIAGIRPIEEMLRAGDSAQLPRRTASLHESDLTRAFAKPEDTLAGEMRMVDIATPVSFGGFTRAAIEKFAPQLRALGLEPRQGVSAGARLETRMGNRSALQPGSMISVQLMTGDLSVGADGTVTYLDGDKIYAFGHRFLSIGPTELPFARSEVMTLLPNLATSFKISTPKEWMGTISQDRNTAVAGELGRRARMVPLNMSLARQGRKSEAYSMQMANDRFLVPLLTQIAVFSTIDANERAVGAATCRVTGEVEFQGSAPPLKLNNMFAGDSNTAMQVALSTAIPLAYVLQSPFSALEVKKIALNIETFTEKKQLQIDQVSAAPHDVRPGGNVRVTAVLIGENGAEMTRSVDYPVPVGAPAGPLYFTVADGNTTNLSEYRQILGTVPRTAEQLIHTVNKLRGNTKAYVRVWRAEPNFQIDGDDFPDPPPSLALVLSASQNAVELRNSKVGEFEISAGDAVISGLKTVRVDVKE